MYSYGMKLEIDSVHYFFHVYGECFELAIK
jgi:hypothetical protein